MIFNSLAAASATFSRSRGPHRAPWRLDYKRGPVLDVSAKETEQLFDVVVVVGADGEPAVTTL
jgi:hypothetical protein